MSAFKHAAGIQLAQIQLPPHATPGTIFSPPDTGDDFEVTLIMFCNPSDEARTVRLFHDDDGTTFAESTALLWDLSVGVGETYIFNASTLNGGIAVSSAGALGASCDSDGLITATVYGVPGQPDTETTLT